MTNQINVNAGVVLTITRPDGAVERVVNTDWTTLAEKTFAMIQKATREAGRGEVTAWEQITRMVDVAQPTAADIAEQGAYDARRAVARMSATGHA